MRVVYDNQRQFLKIRKRKISYRISARHSLLKIKCVTADIKENAVVRQAVMSSVC